MTTNTTKPNTTKPTNTNGTKTMTKPTTKATFKSMDVAACNVAIASIAKRGAKLDADIQTVGLNILNHVAEHREVSLVLKLYNAMPKGSRRNALADWFQRFGQVTVNTDKASAKERPFLFAKDKTTDVQGAIATAWYECKPEKELADEFNFAAQLAALLKRAESAREHGVKIVGGDILAKVREVTAA